MKLKFVGLLFVFFGIFLNSFAQIQPDEKQLSAYNELNKKYNNSLRVEWNKKSGIPEVITFSKPFSLDIDKEKSSRYFLRDIKELIKYRSRIDTLVEVKNRERKGITHIRYQQKYGTVPVKGGEYVVTVLNDGKIQTAIGFFYNDIKIETNPKLSSAEAFEKAFNSPPKKGYSLKDSLYSNELIIYPFEEDFYLAYEIHIPGKRGGESWCYFINALDGKIIEIKSDVINSQANVYLRYPGLDASYTTISPLTHFFDNTALMGIYANILNDESSRAYSGGNDFRYSTGNTHFDEANLYYHVDRIATYFNALGFDEFTQITAHAHTDFFDDNDNPSPNASYDPNDHNLRFSDGQGIAGFNSFAREDNIIYHEYTHAVTDFASGGLLNANESGAIHEGNSDYFAKSKTGRTVIGEYACPAYQRDITNPCFYTYEEYLSDPLRKPHDGGEFWAACLWDIRNELNSTVADNIILDACYDLPANCTFYQYMQRILDADINNYNGSHQAELASIFNNRGLFGGFVLTWIHGSLILHDLHYTDSPLVVGSGVTLTITQNGGIIFGENGSLTINSGGTLNATGTEANPITFEFCSPNSSTQNGIKFNSGSSGNINYCQIRNAYRGIYENGVNVNISNTAISGCTDGIYLYSSSPTIQDCNIHNNTTGINLLYSSPIIKENYIQNNYNGIYCSTNSHPTIGNNSPQVGNYINTNGYGVIVFNNANPVIGNSSSSGYNNLVNSTYNVLNTTGNVVYAYNNWWGTTNPSNFKITSGNVLYSPYRTSAVSIPSPPLSKANGNLIVSASSDIPMLSELNKVYQFIASNSLSEARNLCLNLINNYPDYSVSYNALNLLKETYFENELAAKNDVYKSLFNTKSKKDLYAMAGLILSDLDKENKLKHIEEVLAAYKGERVAELALFDKLVYYYFELHDKENAKLISKELDEQFPLSEGAVEAHKILGDEKYFNIEPIRKNIQNSLKQSTTEYSLSNYPNPFNPVTTINYTLPVEEKVLIKVYDILGREIALLVNEFKTAGKYSVEFNGSRLSSGVYFYSITTGNYNKTMKMILTK